MNTTSQNQNKYRYWVFTWNATERELFPGTYYLPDRLHLKAVFEMLCDEFVFQEEVGEKGRSHYQGVLKLKNRTRFATIMSQMGLFFRDEETIEAMKNLTLDRMRGTWAEAVNYCTKLETRTGEIVSNILSEEYSGSDLNFLEDPQKRYPWQNSLFEKMFEDDMVTLKVADDREIVWIHDARGNSGKSKFVKFLCSNYPSIVKITFGTAPQLRSAIISCGQRRVYLIDMTRVHSKEDSLESLMSTVEDLKNGFVVSVFYGKYQQLLMEPPFVIVFSNEKCPEKMMSEDRWARYYIHPEKKELRDEYDFS
jgi:hypothetical protein|nr:rep protein [Cressdnaviricota sp.]